MPTPVAASVLEVDLGAVVSNWRTLCARHAGPVGGVLKADAYGLGAPQVAAALHAAGCRHVFVAHLQEALAIRDVLPGTMLAVLNGLWPGDAAAYAAAGIVPVLGSLAEVDDYAAQARTGARLLPALLHVDTGMNRLGLPVSELDALAADPGRMRGIQVLFVMTHLAAAEVPGDPANARQHAAFSAACARLPPAPRSLSNSSGIFLQGFGSDLARPGAALYGVNPVPDQPNPMRPVVRLRAQVLQVRDVPTGAGVGYNATWTAARPSRIATVPVGYADGYPRSLSNQAVACFDGAPVPLVGRVSMDLATFDVTDLSAVQPGAWLDLIGPGMPVDEVARRAGTNAYEILTQLGPRYRRTYLSA